MANALYPISKKAFLDGGIDLLSNDIRVILVDLADYSYNAAHDFLDDVPGAARVATSAALGTKSTTAGVFDAADITFSAVTGDQSEALVIYQHTGTEGTSRLIAFFDTGVTGLPVTPNGGDITITWNASGIFAI
jgi:hypothetical protein